MLQTVLWMNNVSYKCSVKNFLVSTNKTKSFLTFWSMSISSCGVSPCSMCWTVTNALKNAISRL